MNNQLTDITVVLDRSGSMTSVASDTIGGFNTFLADQRKASGTALITLNQFDDVFEHVIKAENVQYAPELTKETFKPRGSTALLDAIGRSINETGKRLADMPENDRPAKVVMVIITDGQENASREFDKAKIDAMIREQRDKWNWEFVFLGANQDAISTAASLGIGAKSSMTYAANAQGTSAAFAATSRNLSAMRCQVSQGNLMASVNYTEADREEQRKAGA